MSLAGAAATVAFIWRPWQSCPGDEFGGGCPMLFSESVVWSAGASVWVAGLVVCGLAWLAHPRPR